MKEERKSDDLRRDLEKEEKKSDGLRHDLEKEKEDCREDIEALREVSVHSLWLSIKLIICAVDSVDYASTPSCFLRSCTVKNPGQV